MNHSRGDPTHETERLGQLFGELVDRPTPELDSDGLWQRTEAEITRSVAPVPGADSPRARLTLPRFAWAAAALAAAFLLLWSSIDRQAGVAAPEIVLLTPALSAQSASGPATVPPGAPGESAESEEGVPSGAPARLEVRLVRGYNGPPPADVRDAAVYGTGGADPLRDVHDRIAALLPFESFALVGRGEQELADGAALEIVLSGDYRLLTRSIQTATQPEGVVRLEGVGLSGPDQASTPVDLSLEPGRLYILGVLPAGVEDPELVLLMRARARRGR